MKSSRPADLDSMGKSNESIRLLDWRSCEQFFLIHGIGLILQSGLFLCVAAHIAATHKRSFHG